MNAQEFADLCLKNNASPEGLAEIQGLSPAEWWEKTERGDWMEWLLNKTGQRLELTMQAELNRVTASAWAEYDHSIREGWDEYNRARAEALRKVLGNPFVVKKNG